MLNSYIVISVLLAIAFIILGAVTLSRNSRSPLNRLFMLFSSFLAVWLVSNYLAGDSAISHDVALIANRLVFAFGCASTFAIFLFIKNLISRGLNRIEKVLVGLNVISIVGSFTPLIVTGIKPDEGTYLITFGWLSNIYFLAILLDAIFIILNLIYGKRHSQGVLRAQILVIQSSFATGLIAIIITNALLPFLFGYFGLTSAGSFFSAIFVVGIAYAILKHKLFDIRLIVARTLAYALSLGLIVIIYAFTVLVIFMRFGGDSASTLIQQVFYLATAIALGISFTPIKRFFDRVTNTLFYRDAYEPQELLNKLNQILVSTIELNKLLNGSAEIISDTLKSTFCVFGLNVKGSEHLRIIGTENKKFDNLDHKLIQKAPVGKTAKTILVDDLADDQSELRSHLQSNEIVLLAVLAEKSSKADASLGYIMLGAKKSGSIYSGQDAHIMEIIANEFVIAIQNAMRFEEIEQFNITLQEKVDDATRRLRSTNEKLKALDETKDEFISMASHQLRTPLTSVKGYISMVMEGDAGKISAAQSKLLDQAFVSSQRMVYLIADLLNVSRLRTGKFVIEAMPTNLAELVEGEISQLKETAAARNLELTYEKPAKFTNLMLDENKIRQVVMNFVDNAIYYTPTGGHIKVSLKDLGTSVEFTVEDDGLGVPKPDQHHLFAKFYRAGNARKARPDGTGLGLFMAKKVVVAQGGSIIFKSTEGKGSAFGFTFAKSKVAVPAHAGSAHAVPAHTEKHSDS